MRETQNPFQTRFEEFEPEVPEAVWQKIERRLDVEMPVQRKVIRWQVWQRRIMIAASVSVIAFSSWWMGKQSALEAQEPSLVTSELPTKAPAKPMQEAAEDAVPQIQEAENQAVNSQLISAPEECKESAMQSSVMLVAAGKSQPKTANLCNTQPNTETTKPQAILVTDNAKSNQLKAVIAQTKAASDSARNLPVESNLVPVIFAAQPDEFGVVPEEPETLRIPEEMLMKYLQAKQELDALKKQQAKLHTQNPGNRVVRYTDENTEEPKGIWKTANQMMQRVSNDDRAGYRVQKANDRTTYTVKLGNISVTRKVSRPRE